ncbi:hypothetical protein HDV06_007132 [Boothiomyces sp. JEL0866]|nr:hypothetical protein HDV06_007132 [Boothiomyces sp. JEL0866]
MFEKDSTETKVIESLPFIGYLAAQQHSNCNNNEQAKRAIAKTTNSSILTVGAIAGALVAGPAGLVAGSIISAVAGTAAEATISDQMVSDPVVKSELAQHSVKDYLLSATFASVTSAFHTVGSVTTKLVMNEIGVHGVRKAIVGYFGGRTLSFIFSDIPQMQINKDVESKKVKIIAHDGKCFDVLVAGSVVGKSNTITDSQVFLVSFLNYYQVVIQDHQGYFLQLEEGNDLATREVITSNSAIFDIEKVEGKVAFRSFTSGKYISAYPSGTIICDTNTVGPLEKFTLECL